MNKSRKKAQREAILKARAQRLHEIWNPDLPEAKLRHFQETCRRYFEAYDAVSRPASIARKPYHDESTPLTHTGGPFLLAPHEEWPSNSSGPLAAVLEVHLNEVPVLPDPLLGFQLLQVFLELQLDDDEPAYANGGWHIRIHRGHEPRVPVSHGVQVDRQTIAWSPIEDDVPNYPDDLDLIPDELRDEFETLPNWSELFADRYSSSGLATRIGGWPHWVDSGGDLGTFCLQLHDDVIPVSFGFDGSLYFGLDSSNDRWKCIWEIG